jgi:hypothetical protein
MMVLLATLQGNDSANTLTANNIPTSYGKILVKGVFRVTGSSDSNLRVGFSSSTNINNFALTSDTTTLTTWATGGVSGFATATASAWIPSASRDAGRMLSFEMDISNRFTGFTKIPFMTLSSSATAGTDQITQLAGPNLQSNAQVTSLTFTNNNLAAWSSNTIIHVYGIN